MSLLVAFHALLRRDHTQPVLRFADAAQEQRFIDSTREARARHFMVSGWVALVVFNLFLLSDWLMVPDVLWLAACLRLLVVTPTALIVLYLIWRRMGPMQRLSAGGFEAVIVASGVAAASCLTVVLIVTDSPYAGMYRCGLLPILVYGTLVQRFRFRFALAFAASVVGCHVASMVLAVGQASPYPEIELPAFLVLLVVAAYTLVMNFRMEKEERHRFAQKEHQAALRDALEASRAQLHALSRQDALTGVPNRRGFDEMAQMRWRAHQRPDDALAVLLVDVDHFKAYNDHLGHPAGDQCLRLVAQALQSALDTPDAALARWGGEEFIVLLSHTDEVRARAVAERLCVAVRALALRHEAPGAGRVVTISVGGALARPALDRRQLPSVVGQADAALYEAKRGGRDRVCFDARPAQPT